MTDRIDDKIDAAFSLRERKRELEAEIKAIGKEIDAINAWLIERYDEIGTVTGRGKLANAVLTETVVPNIEDWGLVSEWVIENDAVYLLHRRVSSGPWKELIDAGQHVPGIAPFTKRAISLTKLRD